MSGDDLNWYRGRRVFVTGHTGFKGAWLSIWLQKLGAKLTGYALAPQTPGLFADADTARAMTSLHGDIRDYAALEKAMAKAEPEIVFHMAAQSLVRRSYALPVETFETNVIGTVNVLEAARKLKSLKAVIVVSSDKCYENPETGEAFSESAPLGGDDPYSASKACTEIVAHAYGKSFFNNNAVIASARAGNVIGGCDWAADRIIPDLMRAAVECSPAQIRRPEAVRPWQHVFEPLMGYLLLGKAVTVQGRKFEGGWNFGPNPNNTVSVRTVVDKVAALIPDLQIKYATNSDGPKEAGFLTLDSAKAMRELGWRPRLDIDEAIALTHELYRISSEQPLALYDTALAQIKAYEGVSFPETKKS